MTDNTHVEKGAGLARGPALVIGAILAAAGLVLFLKTGNTPTDTFPDGTQQGTTFLGFETNGWTAWFTTAAGALLLFGAAQHLLAKTMSLLVGLALGACAVITLIDGDDVLGLAAANTWTVLAWGVAAAILLLNTLLPRRRHKVDDEVHTTRREPVAVTPPPPVRREREPEVRRDPEVDRTGRFEREPEGEPVTMRPANGTPVPGTRRVAEDGRPGSERR